MCTFPELGEYLSEDTVDSSWSFMIRVNVVASEWLYCCLWYSSYQKHEGKKLQAVFYIGQWVSTADDVLKNADNILCMVVKFILWPGYRCGVSRMQSPLVAARTGYLFSILLAIGWAPTVGQSPTGCLRSGSLKIFIVGILNVASK